MGKARQTKKFAAVKRMISSKDQRLKQNQQKYVEHEEKRKEVMDKQAPDGVEVKEMYYPLIA